MVSGVSETQPQDDLEDRLEQEREKSQDGEQAIADECFITLSSLEEGFGDGFGGIIISFCCCEVDHSNMGRIVI